jgi:tetratricopeptide (TPR) repeat protein
MEPFDITPEMATRIHEMDNQQLLHFSQNRENPTDDADMEVRIYTDYIIFQRQKSMSHLDEAIRRATPWFAATPNTHPDQDRRRSILDTLVAQKLAAVEGGMSNLTLVGSQNQQHPQSSVQTGQTSTTPAVPIVPGIPATPAEQAVLDRLGADFDIQAAQRLFAGNPDPASHWNALAMISMGRFEMTQAAEDVTRAAKFLQLAIITAPLNHPGRPMYFNNWASCLQRRVEVVGISSDIDFAVKAAEEAIKLTGPEHSDWAMILNTLGGCLGKRYEVAGNIEDLDLAVGAKEASVRSTPSDHPKRFSRMESLALSLSHRYAKTGQIEDLRRGIDVVDESLRLISSDHPNHASKVIGLVGKLIQLYEKTRLLQDLERIETTLERVIKETPLDQPTRPVFLTSLLKALGLRYAQTKELQSLDRAIEVGEEIIELPTNNRVAELAYLKDLGQSYSKRFERTGQISDISRAIELMELLLGLLPLDHSDRPECLNELARSLGKRGEITEGTVDVERSIKLADESVQAISNHPNRAMHLEVLGSSLLRYFEITGSVQELDRGIEVFEEAVRVEPSNSADRALHLSAFGLGLCRRYERLRALRDLDGSIAALTEAVRITPKDNPFLPRYLNGLGFALSNRFGRIGTRRDLDRAVESLTEAVDISPSDLPNRHIVLNSLGAFLSNRYNKFRVSEDLDQAINTLEEAVNASPEDSWFKAQTLRSLASSIESRYSTTENIEDLDRVIHILSNAAKIVPSTHSSRAIYLMDLGNALNRRFRRTNRKEDKDKSLEWLREGWKSENSTPLHRVRLGMLLASILGEDSAWGEAYRILKEAVGLIPSISPRTLSLVDQQFLVKDLGGLGSQAAAVALNDGQSALHALQLLELGRGVISGLLLDMRTDISELRQRHPELAQRLTYLWDQLDYSESTDNTIELDTIAPGWDIKEKRRGEADKQLGLLLKEIQTKPGFEHFLGPPSEEDVKATAIHGPVIVINVSLYRSDAFIIDLHQIKVLRLPNLTTENADANVQRQHVMQSMLEWLWDAAAKPILDALGFTGPPKDKENWPHIWWVPPGRLIQVPIHAAGYHTKGSTNTVLDRVMSSYSSSIRALIHTRRLKTRKMPQHPSASALLVAMEETVGLGTGSLLEFAAQEVDQLRGFCLSLDLRPEQPEPCRLDILKELRTCHIFHFAGHGKVDSADPSRSSLLLKDWQDSPLTVADLREQNFQENAPFLGYLSACSTGIDVSEGLADESIHLIGALQLAGFRHVIGTLLDVSDKRCVTVAQLFYQTMVDKGMTDETVCLGLHLAVRELRSQSWNDSNSSTSSVAQTGIRKSSLDDSKEVFNITPRSAFH